MAEIIREHFAEFGTIFTQKLLEQKEEIKREFRHDFRVVLEQTRQDLKRDIREEMHAVVEASRQKIVLDLADFLTTNTTPRICDLEDDMKRVKNHIGII